MKRFFEKIYESAAKMNYRNVLELLEKNNSSKILDLGCDNGDFTLKIAKEIDSPYLFGVEIAKKSAREAEKKGIKTSSFDLNGRFDFPSNHFDAVIANQVIEHLHNSDNFLSEIHRILKPGGYAVISTENASSWCNILASIMGWQIFSLTNFSGKKPGIGNPLALHKQSGIGMDSWNHIRIYNIRGLKEYLEAFSFKIEKIMGAGYFPLPGILGNIDKTHCHFMTFKIKK